MCAEPTIRPPTTAAHSFSLPCCSLSSLPLRSLINRKPDFIEPCLSYSKQRTVAKINRKLSASFSSAVGPSTYRAPSRAR